MNTGQGHGPGGWVCVGPGAQTGAAGGRGADTEDRRPDEPHEQGSAQGTVAV